MKEMYGFAVGKRSISPEYFLHEMGIEELSCLEKSYLDEYKERWEQTRTVAHAVIASQSSKPIKATDVIPFGWDKEENKEKKTDMEDFNRMVEKFNM